jgi:hypothetical protein
MTGLVRVRLLSATAMLTVAAGCATAARGAAVQARLGEPFQLPRAQSAVVAGEPLSVRFATVVSDSRCPANVQCVRAGEARVRLELSLPGREVEDVILATEGAEPRYASLGAYDVHLDGLAPQPRTDVPRPQYVATLRVTRH